MNNIIVLISYFNSTNKVNLIDRLQYDLIRFLIIWQWLTFWATMYIAPTLPQATDVRHKIVTRSRLKMQDWKETD